MLRPAGMLWWRPCNEVCPFICDVIELAIIGVNKNIKIIFSNFKVIHLK